MSGARAALRVENRVAVRVRALIFDSSLQPRGCGTLFRAALEALAEGESRRTFSEGETRAVRRAMRLV